MKTRDTISAQTHAELLNRLLHKQLKRYMQCRYNLHNGYMIWMIKLDGDESKEGWTNYITNYGNTVIEKYTGNPRTKLVTHYELPDERRLIFGINGNSYNRYYTFYGVFEIDKSSTSNKRIWNKISDYYNF